MTRWLSIAGNYTYDDSRVLARSNFFDPALAQETGFSIDRFIPRI